MCQIAIFCNLERYLFRPGCTGNLLHEALGHNSRPTPDPTMKHPHMVNCQNVYTFSSKFLIKWGAFR